MLPNLRSHAFALALGLGSSLLIGCSVDTQGGLDEPEGAAQGSDSGSDAYADSAKEADSSLVDSGVDADVSVDVDASLDVSVDVDADDSVDVDADDSVDVDASEVGEGSTDADASDSVDSSDVANEPDVELDSAMADTTTDPDSPVLDSSSDVLDAWDSASDSAVQSDADATVDGASDATTDVGGCVVGNDACDRDCDGVQAKNCGGLDCCDTDSRVFPGQTAYYAEVGKCGGFDFNCDGVETKHWGSGDGCKWCPIDGWCCADEGLYTSGPPECGKEGKVAHCSNDVVCKNGSEQRKQECR